LEHGHDQKRTTRLDERTAQARRVGGVDVRGSAMQTISVMMTVAKVQTLADGGLRVTLDMSEKDVIQMAQFVECKRAGVVLQAEFTPLADELPEGNEYGL